METGNPGGHRDDGVVVYTTEEPAMRQRSIRNPQSAIRNSRLGFTLVEIMLVVVIIGVLAAMLVPRVGGRTAQAKDARAKSDIEAIAAAVELYELDLSDYPGTGGFACLTDNSLSTAPDLGTPGCPKKAGTKWQGPYLKRAILDDPWKKPYVYTTAPPTGAPAGLRYYIYSSGSDGQPLNSDDITSWQG